MELLRMHGARRALSLSYLNHGEVDDPAAQQLICRKARECCAASNAPFLLFALDSIDAASFSPEVPSRVLPLSSAYDVKDV